MTATDPTTGAVTPTAHTSARALAWQRRRRALRSSWTIFRHNRQAMIGLIILLATVAVALLSPFLVSPDDLDPATATGTPNSPPSPGYPLGTDNFGRSVLDLVIAGTRVSLMVGVTATIGAVFIGALVGLVSGFYGGRAIDKALNALTDWFLVIPWLVLAIALAAILGPTIWNIVAVIAITSWATTARLVRAQTLSVRNLSYIERARVLGASDWKLITRHILPNVWPVIFANTVLTVSIAILSETTLAILGLGPADAISWGRIIEEAFNAGAMTNGYWWWMIPPGVAIVVVCLAFSMCGHALDEILNPKLRRR